jgi:hypothetical protein
MIKREYFTQKKELMRICNVFKKNKHRFGEIFTK